MSEFEIAHIREQGQDMIVVPLSDEFGRKTPQQQAATERELQICANAAGLAGTVVTVWDGGGGRLHFRAPREWRPFFQSIDLAWVSMQLNRTLTCR